MKKILFIGDLRVDYNYGAMATTTCLLDMLKQQNYDAEYRFIALRSLYGPTPRKGFPKKTTDRNRSVDKLKTIIKNIVPQKLISTIRGSKSSNSSSDFVPYKFSQYEDYYKMMMDEGTSSLKYEKDLLTWADVVLINGEGNIVQGTDKYGKYRLGARYILFMAWVSKIKFKHPTIIVNHCIDPGNANAFEMIEGIYPHLDEIIVRDPLSLNLLKNHDIRNAKWAADALFSYQSLEEEWEPSPELRKQIDFNKPYICIGDSSGIKNSYNQVKWDVVSVFSEMISKIRMVVPQIIFIDGYCGENEHINQIIKDNSIGSISPQNCNYRELYQVFKRSEVFVSGSWHASILCVLENTPIVSYGADSHKTKSLYTILDYPYRFFETASLPVNIDELVNTVKDVIREKSIIKAQLNAKIDSLSNNAFENARVLDKYID